jgi:CRISPR-associated protein Cas2
MLFVVAYDIPDDARRTRLAKELENWGQRAQYSVFECDLDQARADVMIDRLRELTGPEDQLRVYRLCEACVRESVNVRGPGFERNPNFYQV